MKHIIEDLTSDIAPARVRTIHPKTHTVQLTFILGERQNMWKPLSQPSHRSIFSGSERFRQSLHLAFSAERDHWTEDSSWAKWTNSWESEVLDMMEDSQLRITFSDSAVRRKVGAGKGAVKVRKWR